MPIGVVSGIVTVEINTYTPGVVLYFNKGGSKSIMYYILVSIPIIVLLYVALTYAKIKAMPEGTESMSKLALIIRNGSKTFLKIEFKTIAIVVAALAAVFSVFIEKWSGTTFLIGALMSSLACYVGMKSATYANVRTANVARTTSSFGQAIKTALSGGSISGLSVQAFGTLGIFVILFIFGDIDPNSSGFGLIKMAECNPTIMRFTTYSLGCSIVAMFNRVAGGNFTKAADIGSDIVGKNRHEMPEDDSRNPSTLADFVGDNVNDIAGNCSDLLESYVATIVSAFMIAITIYNSALNSGFEASEELFKATCMFPLFLACAGLLGSLLGIIITTIRKMGQNPAKELDLATYISSAITVVGGAAAAYFCFNNVVLYDNFKLGWISPFLCAVIGIISGVLIGKITEYYTSADYKPTRKLADASREGAAFLITRCDSLGWRSCFFPVSTIVISMLFAGGLCGTYGIATAALGMLSFVGTTISIDAFGPISDNAGGIAESCHLDPSCREITDKLDSAGNTTAAIGKGFAIGSAAYATVALMCAFVGGYSSGEPVLNAVSITVLAGILFGGGAAISFFVGILGDNTIDSATVMADESDRQLSIPGVMEGTVAPDYEKCIDLCTRLALKKMLSPSMLAIVMPIIGGLLFGVEFIGGLLIGATIVAIPLAIFMGNSGGAADNNKKYIESGALGEGHGKGSETHKVAVTGDTTGDTRKDVIGVALDIFIKMMSTVANTICPIIKTFCLFH